MDMMKCIDMDPNIFLGIANDRLRHECHNLKSLASLMDTDQIKIEQRLAQIGFHYEAELNQFMPDNL